MRLLLKTALALLAEGVAEAAWVIPGGTGTNRGIGTKRKVGRR